MPKLRPGISKPQWIALYDPEIKTRYGFTFRTLKHYLIDDGMTITFLANGPIREITHCKPNIRRRVWWDPATKDYYVIIGDIAWPCDYWDRLGLEVSSTRLHDKNI